MDDPFGVTIIVPFPWESRASGIQDDEQKGAAWYQRVITAPAEWRDGEGDGETAAIARWRLHPYLCFGAVDWNAKVWVNGRYAGEHDGGYTPFEIDLSRFVRPGEPAALTVRTWDNSAADTPLGKQTVNWYTTSSGIWQTVWLEGRPAAHLTRIHVTPHLEEGRATFEIRARGVQGGARLVVQSTDGAFPTVETALASETATAENTVEATVEVPLPDPRAWSPETPYLYECSVTLGDDTVHTYFGLRTLSKGRYGAKPYEYVFLNGAPVYLRGALDQAFHPDGLHAYPTDDAIRADIQAAKDAGLNMLRCHIKVNDPRYYYWCDRLGVLMMYDLPSYRVYTARARANWELTFRAALERDYSHPCIFSWILFNETWGLEEHQTPASWAWVKEMFDLCKQLDPTRLVEDNSACLYDHVDTDINTWHFYIDEHDRARRHVQRVVDQTYEGSTYNYVSGLYGHEDGAGGYKQGTQPLLNSEYAGLSARMGDKDISYTFKFLTTELRRHDKICGYVYTELADIEWEHNGLLNYDRSWKEFGYDHFVEGMSLADLNGADFVGLDAPPCQTLAPGGRFRAPIFVSHWDRRRIERGRLRWTVTFVDRFGERRRVDAGECEVAPSQYGVIDAGVLEAPMPEEPGLATVALWLMDGDEVRARNYVNVYVDDGTGLAPRERWGRTEVLRFNPADFADSNWPNPRLGSGGAKFGAGGAGWVEYAVPLPDRLDLGKVTGLRLRMELGARTARSRVGWHDPRHEHVTDYPQTEDYKLPSRVAVSVNGVPLETIDLPDDPADARGVLSAHNSSRWEFASYGFLTTVTADAIKLRQVRDAARDGQLIVRLEVPRTGVRGGLNLYGARLGAYPVDPMVLLDVLDVE